MSCGAATCDLIVVLETSSTASQGSLTGLVELYLSAGSAGLFGRLGLRGSEQDGHVLFQVARNHSKGLGGKSTRGTSNERQTKL